MPDIKLVQLTCNLNNLMSVGKISTFAVLLLLVACNNDANDLSITSNKQVEPKENLVVVKDEIIATTKFSEAKILEQLKKLRLVGVVFSNDINSVALISSGNSTKPFPYQKGQEPIEGIEITEILSDEIIVLATHKLFKIRIISKSESAKQELIKSASNTDINSNAGNTSMPQGMIPYSPASTNQQSSNSEFREALEKRFKSN